MTPQDQEPWPEHAVCARCGTPLGQDYQESPLGLRFCEDCFDGAVREKARERAAEIYLRGRCSRCGGSLINGYRLSTFGVVRCLSCSESPRDAGTADLPAGRAAGGEDAGDEPAGGRAEAVAATILWAGLFLSHLLLFVDILVSPAAGSFLARPDSYFRGLICLDLLTIVALLASKRLPASRYAAICTLLIAAAFIILLGREVLGLMR
jgi:hypothetical protein